MEIDGYQVTDASPLAGGGYSTTLVDDWGNVVATVTRDPAGFTQAAVTDNVDTDRFDLSGILNKVTSFLDNVAKSAQATSDEATRVANAAKGAVAGARIGYNGPTNWKPWLFAAGAVVLVLVGNAAANSRRR